MKDLKEQLLNEANNAQNKTIYDCLIYVFKTFASDKNDKAFKDLQEILTENNMYQDFVNYVKQQTGEDNSIGIMLSNLNVTVKNGKVLY